MNLWGTHLKEYSNFTHSFYTNIQIAIGQIPASKMLQVSHTQTMLIMLIQYFVTVYYVISVFFGIYQDCYSMVVQKMGYPRFYDKKYDFTLKSKVFWKCWVFRVLVLDFEYRVLEQKMPEKQEEMRFEFENLFCIIIYN